MMTNPPPSSVVGRAPFSPSVRRFVATAALLGGLLASFDALAAFTVGAKPKVVFFAEGSPGALDIEGVSDKLAVADDGTTLTFTVPMDSVSTGIEVRDHHMKEKYAHTGQYPNVTLALPRAAIQWPAEVKGAATGNTNAQFTAHGVTKEVTVEYDVRKTKTGYRVKARFPFNASEYGIEIPAYLGITVDPKMRAEANFDLSDAP